MPKRKTKPSKFMTKNQYRLTTTEQTCLERLKTEHGADPYAVRKAAFVQKRRFSEHRGAFAIEDGPHRLNSQSIIFGNDGFQSGVRVRKSVARLVMRLDELNIDILGFGIAPDGYSWAMRVDCDDEQLLNYLVWYFWFDVTIPDANPVKDRLAEYLDENGYMAA